LNLTFSKQTETNANVLQADLAALELSVLSFLAPPVLPVTLFRKLFSSLQVARCDFKNVPKARYNLYTRENQRLTAKESRSQRNSDAAFGTIV
jgi:hypothetical protein